MTKEETKKTDEFVKFLDKSDLRRYRTEIPNIILDNSNSEELALYAHIKRHAGDSGKCFATLETLAKELKWGKKYPLKRKVTKNIKSIIKKGWIRKTGTKKGRTRSVNVYEIVDIWLKNMTHFTQRKEKIIKKKNEIRNGAKNKKIDWNKLAETWAEDNDSEIEEFWKDPDNVKNAIEEYIK